MTRSERTLVGAAVMALFCVYFLGTVTTPPNADDGGIALGYIDRISRGERLHFDFLDYYGPLTYLPPALAYELAGKKAIGVGLWMVVLKLLTLGAAYFAVHRLADRLFGLLAVVVLGVLLGLPWAMFQIPYAHHSTLPLALVTVGLMLDSGRLPTTRRLVLCGLLTAAMALMKVSIGAFVMLGALLYLFYLARPSTDTQGPERMSLVAPVRVAQSLGLLVYPLVLQRFIAEHFDGMYFVYLTAPTLAVVILCGVRLVSDVRSRGPVLHRLKGWALYLGTTVFAYVAVLAAFLGPSALAAYFREQYAVLHYMRLVTDFEPLGVRGLYRGYGEYFWPQLPWLATLLFVAWAVLSRLRAATLGSHREALDAHMLGVFAVVTLHGYVIYSVPDDAHIMQHLLLVAPLIFVPLYHLGHVLFGGTRAFPRWHVAVAAVTLLYTSTLVFIPPRSAYAFGPGDWHNPRLKYLTYHPPWNPWSNPVNPAVSDRVLDQQLDDATRQIDALTQDGESILVLAPQHLIYYASNTVPALPRYGHLYYLLGHGRLETAHFRELVPKKELSALLERPPRVVVRVHGKERIVEVLPELQKALASGNYRLVGRWGVLRIYLRDG